MAIVANVCYHVQASHFEYKKDAFVFGFFLSMITSIERRKQKEMTEESRENPEQIDFGLSN